MEMIWGGLVRDRNCQGWGLYTMGMARWAEARCSAVCRKLATSLWGATMGLEGFMDWVQGRGGAGTPDVGGGACK